MRRSTSLFSDWINYRQFLTKFTIQILNILYLLSGISFCTISSIFLANYSLYLTDFSVILLALALLSGILLITISFLGWCGSGQENSCMVLTYAILLVIVLIIQLISVIVIHIKKGVINKKLLNSLYSAMRIYEVGNKNSQMPLDMLQNNLQCCGIVSYQDWISSSTAIENPSTITKHSPWDKYVNLYKMGSEIGLLNDVNENNYNGNENSQTDHLYLPDSCCKEEYQDQFCGMNTNIELINADGCSTKLKTAVDQNVKIISSLAIIGSILDLLGVIFSWQLLNKLRNKSTNYSTMQNNITSLENLANKHRKIDRKVQLKIDKTRRQILTNKHNQNFNTEMAISQINRDICTSAKNNRISQARPSIPMEESASSSANRKEQRASYQKKSHGKIHSSGHRKLSNKTSSSSKSSKRRDRSIASKKIRQDKD